jgi:hypothetical protein
VNKVEGLVDCMVRGGSSPLGRIEKLCIARVVTGSRHRGELPLDLTVHGALEAHEQLVVRPAAISWSVGSRGM